MNAMDPADLLAALDMARRDLQIAAEYQANLAAQESAEGLRKARTAVAALIEREATLFARIVELADELTVCRHKLTGVDVLTQLVENLRTECVQAESERDALAARVGELEADAARYLWLRGQMFVKRNVATPDRYGLDRYLLSEGIDEDDDRLYIDAAIDSARAEARNG